uniref:Uncharacterized protein n=1 Tax=Rhizophora mucronata TaxID=61149 RepID=A0A2P2NB58_RHIMU
MACANKYLCCCRHLDEFVRNICFQEIND